MFLSLDAVLLGCGDGEERGPSNAEVEAQGGQSGHSTAATAGASGSEQGGAGGNTNSRTGTETTATKSATRLSPDGDLSVSRTSNALGIQGSWTPTVGTDSTLSIKLEGGSLRLDGSTAVVPLLEGTQYDYANYPGATATLDLCRSGASDDPANTVYTLGSCPWAPNLAKSLVGVRFTVADNPIMPRELRVVFKEKGRVASTYVVVTGAGQFMALFADASVPGDSAAPPLNAAQLESIQLYAFPSRRTESPFSILVSNFEVLTGTGWSALPDWVYEAGPGMKVQYAGVNVAGAEFGEKNLPGTYNKDYIYPGQADIDIYAKARMNVIRLPFRWERLQQSLGAELNVEELARLKSTVDYAVGRGMSVILDPHNYGRYGEGIIGKDVSITEFADFWAKLAAVYAQDERVILGLMNEPHDMPSTESWLEATNAAIAAIRKAGAKNLVLVPGNGWTGAHSWASTYYGTPNATVMKGVVDEGQNFAFELHQYFDSDSSGTTPTCVSATIGTERVTPATNWLRSNNFRGFLGEFNGGANDTCYQALDNLLTFIGQNSDVWMGWAVWAGGPWWGENILTVQPRADGKDRPQMSVLKRHLPAQQ
jgi:endoglucanase